jgi:hypothetical protein
VKADAGEATDHLLMLDSANVPADRHPIRAGLVLAAAVAGLVAVAGVLAIALHRVHVPAVGRDEHSGGVRNWIDKTLGPVPPPAAPAGAIGGVTTADVAQQLRDATGAQWSGPTPLQQGQNIRTVTSAGRPLTVNLWTVGQSTVYVHAVTCAFQTDGPASVTDAMRDVLQRCVSAVLPDVALTTQQRKDIADYVRSGQGNPRVVHGATVTVTDEGTSYDVAVSAD